MEKELIEYILWVVGDAVDEQLYVDYLPYDGGSFINGKEELLRQVEKELKEYFENKKTNVLD